MLKKTILAILIFSSLIFSQDEKKSRFPTTIPSNIPATNMDQELLPGISLNPDNFIVDRPLEPELYLMGPGDQLNLYIGGMIQKNYSLTVLPEGNIIIPDVGSIDFKNLTLAEAKYAVNNRIGKYYKTKEFELNIVHLRNFRVFVAGQIKNPGTYFAQGVDRLSRILQKAGGLESWSDPSRIKIERADTVLYANLWEFFYRGKLNGNPYLRNGDIIIVPSIELNNPYVEIFSTSGSKQYVPILQEEELKDFLDRTHLLKSRSDLKHVEFIRKDDKRIVDLLDNGRPEIILESGDEIVIPILRGDIFVSGQVLRPGAYPYIPEFTAWDYISKAGIIESSTDIDDVQVIHFKNKQIETGPDVKVYQGDIVFLGRKSREEYKDWAAILTPVFSLILAVYIAFGK